MTDYLRAFLAPIIAWANALFVSWVRTSVPIAIGAVLTWATPALDWLGVKPDQEGITLAVSAFIGGLWYVLARTLENQHKWPWLATFGGWMLGIPKPPSYAPIHPDNDLMMAEVRE